jgi:hypothetical protein
MRFKVGDAVKVIENKNRFYSKEMKELIGEICTIFRVKKDEYNLVEDDNKWCWGDDMLEPAEEKQPEQVIKDQVQQIAEENERQCKTCKHKSETLTQEPCRSCDEDLLDKWEEKDCDSCKYSNACKYPLGKANKHCLSCFDYDEWKPIMNKMKIILISGKAQHGKDSAANIIKSKLESLGKKVLIAHYGDLVKYTCKTFFNWNGEKDEQGRTLLQRVGTDDIRAKYPNFWVEYVKSILDVFNGEWDYVIIPDTRFLNEIELMKANFDDVTDVCVIRTNFISSLTEEQRKHKSEIALDEHIFDYYLVAEDLGMLERKVDNFIKELEVDKCQ